MWKFNWMLIGVGVMLVLAAVLSPIPTTREVYYYGDNSWIALIPLFFGIGLEILRISFNLLEGISERGFGWRDIAVLFLTFPFLGMIAGGIVYDHSWIYDQAWRESFTFGAIIFVGLYGAILFWAIWILRALKTTKVYWKVRGYLYF